MSPPIRIRIWWRATSKLRQTSRRASKLSGAASSVRIRTATSSGGAGSIPRSLIGRRIIPGGVALGVRALDFRETVEGPGGDAGAIVVQRRVAVRRRACVGRRALRIGRVVWSGNDGRMLEQAGRIAVFRGEHGARRQR